MHTQERVAFTNLLTSIGQFFRHFNSLEHLEGKEIGHDHFQNSIASKKYADRLALHENGLMKATLSWVHFFVSKIAKVDKIKSNNVVTYILKFY